MEKSKDDNIPNTVQVRREVIADPRLSFYDKGVFSFVTMNAERFSPEVTTFDPKEVRKFAKSMRILIKLGYIKWGSK